MHWLKHNEEGLYDEAFRWSYEKRVNTFRMPRGGAKITDPQLENFLLEVVAECGGELLVAQNLSVRVSLYIRK